MLRKLNRSSDPLSLERVRIARRRRKLRLEGNKSIVLGGIEPGRLLRIDVSERSQRVDGLLNMRPAKVAFISFVVGRIDRFGHSLETGDLSIGPPLTDLLPDQLRVPVCDFQLHISIVDVMRPGVIR